MSFRFRCSRTVRCNPAALATFLLMLAGVEHALAEEHRDPVSRVAFQAPDAWTLSPEADPTSVLRATATDPSGQHTFLLLYWQVAPEERARATLVIEQVQNRASALLERFSGAQGAWAVAERPPDRLRFPLVMGPRPPLFQDATGSAGWAQAWIWYGATWAVAVFGATTAGRNPDVFEPILASLRYVPGAPENAYHLSISSWRGNWLAPSGEFSLDFGEGFRSEGNEHSCMGRLSRFRCRYFTDGKVEVLAMTGSGGDERAVVESVEDGLGLPALDCDFWSFPEQATSVVDFYVDGLLAPAAFCRGGGDEYAAALYEADRAFSVILARVPEPVAREEWHSRLSNVRYHGGPSFLLRLAYWGGALLAWLGLFAAVQVFREKRLLGLHAGIPLGICLVFSVVGIGAHLVASPPLPGTWASVTLLLYLPVVLLAVALGVAAFVFGDG